MKQAHLVPNPSDCTKCHTRPCTHFCPAHVYEWDKDQGKFLVGFENCLECGACRIGCTYQTIDWKYPTAGCGVTFKCG